MGRLKHMIVLLAGALWICGCGGIQPPYNVKVSLDQSLKDARGQWTAVEVHVVGANPTDLSRLSSMSMSGYWGNEPLRRNLDKKEMKLGVNPAAVSQTLEASDPVWKRWLDTGATHLLVLAFLPGHFADAEGDRDARRLILPLDGRRWKETKVAETKTIEVSVQSTGLRCLTPPAPEKR